MNANRQFQAPIIEERGYFWWNDAPVPERHFAPDTAVAGTLRIDDEGRIDLDLDGTLPSERNPLSRSPEEFPKNKAIRGILKGSSKHVLLSALTTSRTVLTSHGISYSGYRALYCLLGDDKISLAKLESPFHVLEFDLKGFENWLRLGSIYVDSGEDTYSVKHERPQSEAYDVGCGLVTLKFDLLAPRWVAQVDNLQLIETATLIYRLNAPVNLETAAHISIKVADLFVLMTNSEFDPEWPILRASEAGEKLKLYFWRGKRRGSPPEPYDCWVHFPAVQNAFGRIFSTWLNKCAEFGPGFYLYSGTRRGLHLYSEHRFVNLIWGLEAFHRKKNHGVPRSIKVAEKIQRILGSVDAEDRRWLTEKLRNADEPNLENRMFETLVSVKINLDEDRVRNFAKKCVQLRNDISHFGGQREPGMGTEFIKELELRSDAISYLYQALLLQEIGIENDLLRYHVFEAFKSYPIKKTLVDVGLLDKSIIESPNPAIVTRSPSEEIV